MKNIFLFLSFITLICSCSHQKTSAPQYSPEISFQEEGKNFEAKISLPKKFKEKIPLVLVIHEWWGRNDYINHRVEMLNESGFAALAVDLYGDAKIVETPKEAQELATPFYQNPQLGIKRLEAYLEKAKLDPHIDAEKIFVIGYCFGGTQALNLARSGAKVKGVVSFHGSLATSIKEVTQIPSSILVLHGGSDPMVSAKEVDEFRKEMKKIEAKFKVITYKNATHAFTNPKATEIGKKYNIPISYDESADKKSWNELISFIKEAL
jgi:dienelactone hydrolase